MACAMMFPNTVEEFMEWYKMTDTDHVYSNGTEYVPIFRMEQWFDHVKQQQTHGKHTDTHGVCSDELISRQAAIDALKENMVEMGGDDWCEIGVHKDDIEAIINALPSANKSGHWIDDGDCSICSKCHEAYGLTLLGQLYAPNFCPNCGADMRTSREDYELATEQMEHDAMYEPTYNSEDGSM